MIRVTAEESANGEQRALCSAMPFDRLARVLGACRREAAVRAQQRPEQVLIDANERYEDRAHGYGVAGNTASSRRASTTIRASSLRATGRLMRTITSSPPMRVLLS